MESYVSSSKQNPNFQQIYAWVREQFGGMHPSFDELAIEFYKRCASETSALQSMVTLNGYQLREALEFIAPDGDPEQLESDVTIQWGKTGHSGEGYYACMTEYPDEGCILLDDKPRAALKASAPLPRCVCGKWQFEFSDAMKIEDARSVHYRDRPCHQREESAPDMSMPSTDLRASVEETAKDRQAVKTDERLTPGGPLTAEEIASAVPKRDKHG